MIDGRVLTGDRLLGSGFCIADLFVVTAAHVVEGHSPDDLSFMISNVRMEVDAIDIRPHIDVALLRLRRSMAAVPRLTYGEKMAQWSVMSQPRANDPTLGGVITDTDRKITNVHQCDVFMLQLKADETLGNFYGYSGSAVYIGESVTGVLLEQVNERGRSPNPKGTNVLYALPIETVVREFRLNRDIEPYQSNPRPSGLLLDAAFFDLDALKGQMYATLSGSDDRAVAFGVEYAEPVFVRKLCDWLEHYLGPTQRRDSVILNPTFTSIDGAVRTVQRYLSALDRVSVVCPVPADGIPREYIAGFWDQLHAACPDADHVLVVLFFGRPQGGYPDSVKTLPEPAFATTDIAAWVRHVAMSTATRKWSQAMVDSLRDLIIEQSTDGGGLSIRYTIEALEEYIQLIRFHPDDLRRTLERRSR